MVRYFVIHLHSDQSAVFIVCWCPPVKETGRMEEKNRLERLRK